MLERFCAFVSIIATLDVSVSLGITCSEAFCKTTYIYSHFSMWQSFWDYFIESFLICIEKTIIYFTKFFSWFRVWDVKYIHVSFRRHLSRVCTNSLHDKKKCSIFGTIIEIHVTIVYVETFQHLFKMFLLCILPISPILLWKFIHTTIISCIILHFFAFSIKF